MIVIRDQQLRLLALAQLIRELERASNEKTPPPEGFTEKQLEELRSLSSDELVRLSEMTEPRVAIQIDAGSLEHGLRQVDYLTKRSRQLDYFIRNDGPMSACAAVAPRQTTTWGRRMRISASSQSLQAATSLRLGFS